MIGDQGSVVNVAGLGLGDGEETMEEKEEKVKGIVEQELGVSLHVVCEDWVKRAKQIAGMKGEGH